MKKIILWTMFLCMIFYTAACEKESDMVHEEEKMELQETKECDDESAIVGRWINVKGSYFGARNYYENGIYIAENNETGERREFTYTYNPENEEIQYSSSEGGGINKVIWNDGMAFITGYSKLIPTASYVYVKEENIGKVDKKTYISVVKTILQNEDNKKIEFGESIQVQSGLIYTFDSVFVNKERKEIDLNYTIRNEFESKKEEDLAAQMMLYYDLQSNQAPLGATVYSVLEPYEEDYDDITIADYGAVEGLYEKSYFQDLKNQIMQNEEAFLAIASIRIEGSYYWIDITEYAIELFR